MIWRIQFWIDLKRTTVAISRMERRLSATQAELAEPQSIARREVLTYEQHIIQKSCERLHQTLAAFESYRTEMEDIELRRRKRRAHPPRIALRLFNTADADRYAKEWGAHLWEQQRDKDHRSARRDRQRMAIGGPSFALQLRMGALLRRWARARR